MESCSIHFSTFNWMSGYFFIGPVTLSLGRSLETVIEYYQNRTQVDCGAKVMNPIGQAIVVFSRDGRLTTSDNTRARRSLETIKQGYPQTVMVYVSQDVNGILKVIRDFHVETRKS